MSFANPPDGWIVNTGTWATDIAEASSATLTQSGNYSINFKNTAVAGRLISADYIPLAANNLYKTCFTVRADSTSYAPYFAATYYDYDLAAISTNVLWSSNLAASNTWYIKGGFLFAISTARYVKFIIGKNSADAYNVYVDRVSLDLSPRVARAYRNTSVQSIASATTTKVQFNGESFDTLDEFDSATNYRYVASNPGIYRISGCVQVASMAAGTYAQAYIYVNGSLYAAGDINYPASGSNAVCMVDDVVTLDQAGYVEVWIFQSDSVSRNVTNGSGVTYMSVEELTKGN